VTWRVNSETGLVKPVCKAMDFPELPLMAHLDASRYSGARFGCRDL